MICLALLIGRWYIMSKDAIYATMNTDYPGDRQEIGGGAINNYSYFYNIFFTTNALRDYHYTKQKNNAYYHIDAINLPFQNIEFYYIGGK